MKVSIIIPIYNVEKYILRCLESVRVQTYSNIEVLLIDDRGQDDSMKIIGHFIQKHRRHDWQIIEHQRNLGLSAARNTGIQQASGAYLYFLDSDDAIFPDTIAKLVTCMDTGLIDLVVGGAEEIGFKQPMVESNRKETVFFKEQSEAIDAFLSLKYPVVAWNKLINREFVIRNNLFFQTGLLHEDLLWSFLVALKARKIIISSDITYKYFYNGASITSTRGVKNFLSYEIILKKFKERIENDPLLRSNYKSNVFFEGIKFLAIITLFRSGENVGLKDKKALFIELTGIKTRLRCKPALNTVPFQTIVKRIIMTLPFWCVRLIVTVLY